MQAIMETLFDAVYLTLVITLGVLMIRGSRAGSQFRLFGIMAVVLGAGDVFHLIPRAVALCTTGLEHYAPLLGLGKWITSVTMTIFYVLLYCVWRQRYRVQGHGGLIAVPLPSGRAADRPVHAAAESVAQRGRPPLLGHLPQHPLRPAGPSGDRAVLPQRKGTQ